MALHLSYVQLNDTYLVGMLPFVLLLVGGALASRPAAHLGAGRRRQRRRSRCWSF